MFRYPLDLRARLKQGVLIAIHHYGSDRIYANHIINALDAIRKKVTNSNDRPYSEHEYNRCFTASCEEDGKNWRVENRSKVTQAQMRKAAAIKKNMETAGFWT